MSGGDNPFSRWSERKRAVEAEREQETPVSEPETALPETIEEDETEEQILTRLGLPSPESLGEGDDFTGFMRAGVPDFLRRRALRVLWRSNPVLANLDGLNDYDDDFNSPELTKKVIATGYQVGKGFARRVLAETEEETPDQTTEESEPVDQVDPEEISVSEELQVADAVVEAVDTEPNDPDEPVFRPRRMRFDTSG